MDRSIKIGLAAFAITIAAMTLPGFARADAEQAPPTVSAVAPHVTIAGFSA